MALASSALRTPAHIRRFYKRIKESVNLGAIVGFAITIGGTLYPLVEGEIAVKDVVIIIVGIYITMFFGGYSLGRDLTSEMEALRETVETHADCLYLGRPDEVVIKYQPRLRKATKIRNTFVAFRTANDQDIKNYLSKNPRDQIVQSQSWDDIFSEESLAFKELREFLDRQPSQRYSAYVLRRPYPIVNFVLLEFGDEEPEVLFGWGFHHKDSMGSVYVSKALYALFNRYWEALSDDSVPLIVEGRVCMTRYEIKGLWLTVAFPGHATGIIPASSPLNVALTVISIDHAQRLAVEIRRYSLQGASSGVNTASIHKTIESKASHLREQELWFVAEIHGKLTAGSYNFVFKKEGNKDVLCFYGNFIEQDTQEVIGVYGRQLKLEAAFPKDPLVTTEYLSKYDEMVLSFWSRAPKHPISPQAFDDGRSVNQAPTPPSHISPDNSIHA